MNEAGETEFYVLPEAFKVEVCQGLDWRFVARERVERGLVYPDKDGKKALTPHKPPGMKKTLRLYHFAASILDSEG